MTPEPTGDLLFASRLRHIIATTVAGLDERDRTARIQYCREHQAHGVTVHADVDPQYIRLTWGGALLAVVDRNVFTGDSFFAELDVEWLPVVPDDASGLSTE